MPIMSVFPSTPLKESKNVYRQRQLSHHFLQSSQWKGVDQNKRSVHIFPTAYFFPTSHCLKPVDWSHGIFFIKIKSTLLWITKQNKSSANICKINSIVYFYKYSSLVPPFEFPQQQWYNHFILWCVVQETRTSYSV